MDGGTWWVAVQGVVKSWTRLSDFTFTFHFHALEKEMATHSSVLAWRTPGTGEPGGLPSTGSHRVGHDWCDLAAATTSFPLLHWTLLYVMLLKKIIFVEEGFFLYLHVLTKGRLTNVCRIKGSWTPCSSSFKKGSWRLRRDSLSLYFSKAITHNSIPILGPGFLLPERAPPLKAIRFCSCKSSKLKTTTTTNLQPKIKKINLIIVFLGPTPTSQCYQDWGCHKNLSISLEALHLPASSWSHFVLVPYCLASERNIFLR